VEHGVLVIHCAQGGAEALRRMRELGYRLPASVRTFEMACSGRVSEPVLMEALQDGAEGVLVVGCRKDACRYLDGNCRAEKKVARVQELLHDAGIGQKSVQMHFAAPDEGGALYRAVRGFCEKVALHGKGEEAR
jgi:F420-non-reducing hydrogenase iron-sulfur subunit